MSSRSARERQPLALARLRRLVGEFFGHGGRVVDELREDHRPAGGERPARPPQVQRARVAVADRLLACARLVDGIERQPDLDELAAGWGHGLPSLPVRVS
jgi:hypothetical protein